MFVHELGSNLIFGILDLAHLLCNVILLENGQISFIDIGGPCETVINKTGFILSHMFS